MKTINYIFILILAISCSEKNPNEPETPLNIRNGLMAYSAWEFSEELFEKIKTKVELDSIDNRITFLNSESKSLIKFLDGVTEQLVDASGGRNDYYHFINPTEVNAVKNVIFNQGRGTTIKERLTNYSELLRELGNNYSGIPLIIPYNSFLAQDPRLVDVPFEHYHFDEVTLEQSLEIIETYKLLVHLNHSITLNLLLSEKLENKAL
ncbi:MAG: hypothetical protein GY816_06810 [Cytophagales bacterium]|nr:hypothetical protein [Cytophagales bacterium]